MVENLLDGDQFYSNIGEYSNLRFIVLQYDMSDNLMFNVMYMLF